MLSQEDRRELERIASYLRIEDPDFAAAIRDGKPRRLTERRPWRMTAVAVASAAVFLIGAFAAAFTVLVIGAVAFGLSVGVLWVRRRATAGPTIRPSRRRQSY